MKNRFWAVLILLLVIPGLIFTASCAKKQVKSEPMAVQVTGTEDEAEARRLAEEKARKERLREEARQREEREELAARQRFLKKDIHFEFDKSRLLPEAKEMLRYKAEWIMGHPDVKVTIEGHCDERGTNDYNMALGNRRAESVKSFVVDLGIPPERLTTVSYGEERPIDQRNNEEGFAKNRRAHFVID